MRNKTTHPAKPKGRKSPPVTPLLSLLRTLETPEQRAHFAARCGTSVNYLYQLATCKRTSCRVGLAKRIAEASSEMALLYGTPVLSLEVVSTMCAECVA